MWICRDEGYSHCLLFEFMPKKELDKFSQKYYWASYYDNGMMRIGDGLMLHASKFPEVTLENSPMEVELKLIDK